MGVPGSRGGSPTHLGARRKLGGGTGGGFFIYFYKCLSSYHMPGTSAETPRFHRSLASEEKVRVWARDEGSFRQKALQAERPEEMGGFRKGRRMRQGLGKI